MLRAGIRDACRERRVEIRGGPAQRGERFGEVVLADGRRVRGDARQRRDRAGLAVADSTSTSPAAVVSRKRSQTVTLRVRDRRGDRRVSAERHLGLGG